MWRDFFKGFGVRIEFVVLGVEAFCMKIGATDPTVFTSVVVDVSACFTFCHVVSSLFLPH